MVTNETAIAWLEKQSKKKNIALYRATHKPNPSDTEIGNILEALDVIEYLTQLVESTAIQEVKLE